VSRVAGGLRGMAHSTDAFARVSIGCAA